MKSQSHNTVCLTAPISEAFPPSGQQCRRMPWVFSAVPTWWLSFPRTYQDLSIYKHLGQCTWHLGLAWLKLLVATPSPISRQMMLAQDLLPPCLRTASAAAALCQQEGAVGLVFSYSTVWPFYLQKAVKNSATHLTLWSPPYNHQLAFMHKDRYSTKRLKLS